MLTAETVVTTERASRYLIQLCEHANRMGLRPHLHRMHQHAGVAPHAQAVEWSNTHGVMTFDSGQCTIDANGETLTVRVEAADADSLERIRVLVTRRLETIGRRDHLVVPW